MLQMSASRQRVSTGVDLNFHVTTELYFGNAPTARRVGYKAEFRNKFASKRLGGYRCGSDKATRACTGDDVFDERSDVGGIPTVAAAGASDVASRVGGLTRTYCNLAICDKITRFISFFRVDDFCPNQRDFLTRRPCKSNLPLVTRLMDEGYTVDLVQPDFAKAFDSDNHRFF